MLLTFVIQNKQTGKIIVPTIPISINNIVIDGFLSATDVMKVEQLKSACRVQEANTICNVRVPATTQLIELPILYYPDMLNITLNGKVIPYMSILHGKYLLTGITPQANQLNEIKIEFMGLLWANYFSVLGWGLWALFLLFVLLRALQEKFVYNFSHADSELALRLLINDRIRGRASR